MRYCGYCGREVSETAKACGHCGRWLATEPAAPSATEPPVPEPPPEAEMQAPTTADPQMMQEPAIEQRSEPLSAGVTAFGPAAHDSERASSVAESPAPVDAGSPPASVTRSQVQPAPPTRRRGIPAWAWALGGLVIVMALGALAIMAGVPNLTDQESAVPAPTATQELGPESVVEEVRVLLGGRDDVWKTVDAGQPVVVEWVWGVCDQGLVEENLDALTFKVTVDGQVLAQGDMAESRTGLEEEERNGIRAWWQQYSFPVGAFESGSQHELALERGFAREVTDGCDVDGDGNVDWYGTDFTVTSALHVIVR